ncbi:MAG: HU family DNA-binding protein [Nitrospinota bacterium]
MTKLDIVNEISDKTGLPRRESDQAVEHIISTIKESLIADKVVIIRDLGTFKTRHKSARVGRNPKTGVEATISARRVVQFKLGKKLKESI